jgi:hypothetical protein
VLRWASGENKKIISYLGLRIPSNEQIHNMHSSDITSNIFSRKFLNLNLILKRLPEYIYTGWGGQLWTKMGFFQSIGLHVVLKLMLGLKSTGWFGHDPWLTTHSILTSYFLATA